MRHEKYVSKLKNKKRKKKNISTCSQCLQGGNISVIFIFFCNKSFYLFKILMEDMDIY